MTLFSAAEILTAGYAEREAQYDAEFTSALELVLGDGFMCHGSADGVREAFSDIALSGKKVLDFGCGLCGPAFLLAKENAVAITAVDVEPFVIEESKKRLKDLSLKGTVHPEVIEPDSKLNYRTNTFDVIYANECILHVKDKDLVFREMHRILKPGGVLMIHDWLHSGKEYTEQMQTFVLADGLDFHLLTEGEYKSKLRKAKFKKVVCKDTSRQTYLHTNRIIEDLKGDLGHKTEELYGATYLQEYLDSWKMQADVFNNGEMLSASIKAYK